MNRRVRHRDQAVNTRRLFAQAIEQLEDRRLLASPVVGAIGTQSVVAGATIQLPVGGFDADNQQLTYSVSVSGSGVTGAARPNSNTFIEMVVAGYGTMTFQLFDDVAPETVRRIKGLISHGFYDGLTFHRIIQDFMIQGGDPAGNGTGGPDWRFDDEFHPDVTFSNGGQLAMANSGKDTNGSQFFITDFGVTPPKHLNFNHTIFGQLVRGFDILESVIAVPTGANDAPITPVVISSVREVDNNFDGVLVIKADAGASGSRTVTVTATDPDGNTGTRTFTLNINAATAADDRPAILGPLGTTSVTPVNTPIGIQLSGFDPEGGALNYDFVFTSSGNSTSGPGGTTATLNDATGILTVNPGPGFTGKVEILVGVQGPAVPGNNNASRFDTQTFTIAVGDQPISVKGETVYAHVGSNLTGVVIATITDLGGSLSDFDSATVEFGDGHEHPGTIVDNGDGTFSVLADHSYDRLLTDPINVVVLTNLGQVVVAQTRAIVQVAATLSGRVITVNGTSDDDTVSWSTSGGNLRVTVNGANFDFAAGSYDSAIVRLHGGNDLAALSAVAPQMQLFGGTGHDELYGSPFADLINAGPGNDYALGAEGEDTMVGGEGKDTLTGGAQKDLIYGGAGDDRLNGSGGNDRIYGDDGNDRLYGNAGNDTLEGAAGVDRLFGEDGNDFMRGGSSNDKLYGHAGDDTLYGDKGSDILNGGPGIDSGDLRSEDSIFSDSIEIIL